MANHRRVEEPDRYYLLSNRVHEGQFLFRPDRECCRILKGCLARYVVRKNVRLVAYGFPSNHFHLVAGFPDRNRAAFMREFESELSYRINKYRGRSDSIFTKTYHPKTIIGSEALLDKISYTVNNPVRHGLVTHPEAWPGPTSITQHREDTPLVGHWLDRNKWYNLRRRKDPPPRREAMIEYRADLHVPECLPGEDAEERRQSIRARIEQDRKKFCKEAGLDRHRRSKNPEYYRGVDWRQTQEIDEDWCNIRKACEADRDDDEADRIVAEYLEWRREIDRQYRAAAEAWKNGEEATFPIGTYPPGRAQCVEQLEARAPPADAA